MLYFQLQYYLQPKSAQSCEEARQRNLTLEGSECRAPVSLGMHGSPGVDLDMRLCYCVAYSGSSHRFCVSCLIGVSLCRCD